MGGSTVHAHVYTQKYMIVHADHACSTCGMFTLGLLFCNERQVLGIR